MTTPTPPGTGIRAHEAFAHWRPDRPAPPVPVETGPIDTPVRDTPSPNTALPGTPPLDTLRDEPPAPGPALQALRLLAEDAARRATALLAGAEQDGDSPYDVPYDLTASRDLAALHDAARLLSDPAFLPQLEAAATRLGLSVMELRHLTLAHAYGGPAQVTVTARTLPADPRDLAHAESAIQPLRPAPLATLTGEDNRLTDAAARVQLRLGAGRWYPYIDWHGTWRPVAGHSDDPATAYRAARRALRQGDRRVDRGGRLDRGGAG
ncbi:hypothetical protein ACIOEX_20330 [Streptomyces sp. NPDC087850]|uniref:hypothetical protein n=1 Tax=unclassified Streptomyces TaxID=2593676 RepID=UPI0037FB667A